MKISFDNALGIHPAALAYRAQRAEVISNNLINADTPNFKARDISFRDVMEKVNVPGVKLHSTNGRHLSGRMESVGGDLKYRTPLQPSVDGNTVDPEIEQSNYMRNAIEFQASFTFLNGKFKGIAKAIGGNQ